MASGVHAVALRLKQARKKKMLQDLAAQQPSLAIRQPSVAIQHGPNLSVDLPKSPRRSQPFGWDMASSDLSAPLFAEGKTMTEEHRERAEKAHKKWLKKMAASYTKVDFTKSYVAAERNNRVDVFLWMGMTILLTGTVISFVGLGEKGFRSPQLKLLGPILSGFGLAMVIVRICFCCFIQQGHEKTLQPEIQVSKTPPKPGGQALKSLRKSIPGIHVEPTPGHDSGRSRVAMGATAVPSVRVRPEGGENDPLLVIDSPDDSSPEQLRWTSAVIENERVSPATLMIGRPAGQSGAISVWDRQTSQLASELALSPLWLPAVSSPSFDTIQEASGSTSPTSVTAGTWSNDPTMTQTHEK